MSKFTVRDFFNRFPDEDTCLEHVMSVRFGLRHTCKNCGKESTFHKLENRKAYSCAHCGAHVYPCSGTIFQDSRTPLQVWFYAIFLFVTTRHGVSGKELERQLGVTYKTAWRMGQQIRQLMEKADGFEIMQGHIEVDEAQLGGTNREKAVVMGLKQRGGRTVAKVVPNAQKSTLIPVIEANVEKGSVVSTDGAKAYVSLPECGYIHGAVNHSEKDYAHYDYRQKVTHHVNGVESFWHIFQASVHSTHVHISKKYLDRYLSEFTFRSNHREMGNAMFDLLIGAV